MKLRVVPVTVTEARKHVEALHSHHHAPPGALFCVGVADGERLACVAVVSRPVARMLDAVPTVAEITRVASDRTPHAASMAVAAASRGAIALGYRRLVSYTILGESGASYRAAGWWVTGLVAPSDGWLSREGRTVMQDGCKVRWEFGPDALACDGAAALVCGWCAGRVAVPSRAELLPLFAGVPGEGHGTPLRGVLRAGRG